MVKKKDLDKLRYYIAEYDKARADRIGLQGQTIIDSDSNAPLCINCRFCQQNGFLFECILEEELVYYKRKAHKPKTYPNSPKKREECENFEPILL